MLSVALRPTDSLDLVNDQLLDLLGHHRMVRSKLHLIDNRENAFPSAFARAG